MTEIVGAITLDQDISGEESDVLTQQVAINATASGDTTAISAVSGKKLRVLGIMFTCSAAVAVAWKSGANTTKIEAMSFAANGGISSPKIIPGWFVETDSGEALVVNLSGTANVRGTLWYIEV